MKKLKAHDPKLAFDVDYPSCARELHGRVDFLLTDRLGPLEQATFVQPTRVDAVTCIEAGLRLEGSLRLKWEAFGAAIDFKLPLPYHGVFIFGDDKASPGHRKGLWSWLPKLARNPGVWQILRPSLSVPASQDVDPKTSTRLEIVFDSDARFFCKRQGSKNSYLLNEELVARYPQSAVLWDPSAWPAALTEYLQLKPGEPHLFPRGKTLLNLVRKIVEWASSHPNALPEVNGDDLKFQQLVTFESWLVQQLPLRFAQTIASHKECAPKELTPGQRLERLAGCANDVATALFPMRRLRHEGRLVLFAPFNPIDAISQLTRFDRYGLGADSPQYLRPVAHQNHPSFFGPVCPVETPDSKMAGIALHLSRALRKGSNWLSVDASLAPQRDTLGFAANLIPFFEYNDGTRNMIGAKNLNQALPINGRHAPAIDTGGGREVLDAVRPLLDLGLVPAMQDAAGRLATGKDLLVAYLPFHGLNFEDGVVARAEIADDLSYEETKAITEDIPHIYRRGSAGDSPFSAMHPGLDDGLLVKPGSIVRRGDPLAILVDTAREKIGQPNESAEKIFRYEYLEEGVVESASLKLDSVRGGKLTVIVRQRFPLTTGDKIMGRHGNKGVIARLMSDDEMPRLPNDPNLPSKMRNRPIDLVLNPHGVISRMNLGQLVEVHMGWLHYAGMRLSPPLDCAPFSQQVRVRADDISRALSSTGLDAAGRTRLVLPEGKQTEMPVVVGFQHIVRLRHIPTKKIQARHGGHDEHYDPTTGQPVKGRIHLGGQRMGEMEMWALAAHNAPALIEDLLQYRSVAEGKADSARYTWSAVRDHFFALGITVDTDATGLKFGVLAQPAETWSSEAVTSDETIDSAVRAAFQCPTCKKLPPGIEGTFDVRTGKKIPKLTLGVLLREWKLAWTQKEPPKISSDSNGEIIATWKLKVGDAANEKISASVRCRENKSSFGLLIDIPLSQTDHRQVHCTARKPNPEIGATRESLFSAQRIPTKNTRNKRKQKFLLRLIDVSVACPSHPSQALQPTSSHQISVHPLGGLFCREIFGGNPNGRSRWGHIELPLPIANPIFKRLPQFKKTDKDVPLLMSVPVLPLVYRRPRRIASDTDEVTADELTRKGYAPVVRAVAAYRRSSDGTNKVEAGKLKGLAKEIRLAVENLFDRLGHRIADKETGLIRQHALGRRADRSGRAVIVPAPELCPDQCQVPAQIMAAIAGNDIADDFQAGSFEKDREAIKASLRLGHMPSASLMTLALEGIRDFFQRHPEKLVLLNRQPSLHKYSILAFRPVVTASEAVIGLHPLACAPLGADFDGDEITIHWPSTAAAQKDAAKLLLKNNLISVANGQSVIQFSQDLVLGLFLLRRAGKHQAVLDFIPDDCLSILSGASVWTAKEINVTLTAVARNHPDRALDIFQALMGLSLDAGTRHATSFGYFDCLGCEPPEGTVGKMTDAVLARLGGILTGETSTEPAPLGWGLAEMVLSKSRGEKQIVQLVGNRGVLLPGLVSFDACESEFTFKHSLVDGCDAETFFRTAYNNRSSQCDKKLGTGIAGGLTRSMVGHLWDESGDPAGLLAAQSIGERGTQLSMQSFHTSKQAIAAGEVRDVILKKQWSTPEELRLALTSAADSPYKAIDKLHFEVLFAGLRRAAESTEDKSAVLKDLAFASQERILKVAAQAALSGQHDRAGHPVARVMLSGLIPTVSNHG